MKRMLQPILAMVLGLGAADVFAQESLPFPPTPSASIAGRTIQDLFTANDCLDIGTDLGSPVSLDYYDKAPFKFNDTIETVHVHYIK